MKTSFRLKFKITYKAVLFVLKKPAYLISTVLLSFLMAGVIIWSFNYELVGYIIFEAPLNFFEKIEFFSYGYQNLFNTLDSLLSSGILIFSFLFGVNTSMLIYVIKNHGFKNLPKKSSTSAFILAILGGGCIACGTSLLAPILISIGAVSTPFLRDLGAIFNWLGSLLLLYSIYKLSLLVRVKKEN
jgi:hypothetical protein